MLEIDYDIFTKCQNDLAKQGHTLLKLPLNGDILSLVKESNYEKIDLKFKELTSNKGLLFQTLRQFEDFESIEFIISLRESKNEWEEDGIWHDDGSRILAFSLSLTEHPPEGGNLHIRRKGETQASVLPTPSFGEVIIFYTGTRGYEHKIHQVTDGSRLIIAGWCS